MKTKNMTALCLRKSIGSENRKKYMNRRTHNNFVTFVTATLVGAVLLVRPALATDRIEQVERHHIVDHIYEYSWVISTGNDAHHRVGVHRVVKEEHGCPRPSDQAIFLVHGDGWNFNAAFLRGTSLPNSLPVFLAHRGVDVWGIDLGWTLVPSNTTDFTFMRHWGLQRDIDDLEQALSFARSVRTQTGSPHNRLVLLGWSRGGWIGFALLNQESQQRIEERNVRAYIPVDNSFKIQDPAFRASACDFADGTGADLRAGIYAYSSDPVPQLGQLAITDPNGVSPIFGPPYTNLDASLTVGAAAYQLNGPNFLAGEFYHYVGGTFPGGNIWGIPDGLVYTSIPEWNNLLVLDSPFEAVRMEHDTYTISCGAVSTPFDNHLSDITVPVLYVGAGGGFGSNGLYTLTLLGSQDVSSLIVSFYPPEQAAFDFGHVDLFYAQNADDLVWSPIYQWLSTHERE
jgi:pimeloyl-ACP methyl ester carboxylesterase